MIIANSGPIISFARADCLYLPASLSAVARESTKTRIETQGSMYVCVLT